MLSAFRKAGFTSFLLSYNVAKIRNVCEKNMFYNIKSGCSSFIFSRNTIFCNLYMTKMLRKFRKLLSAIIGIIICCPGRMITIACIGGNMMLSGIVGRYTQLPENYCLVRRSQLMSEVCMQYNWGVQYDNEGRFCKAELYYL